MRKKLLIASAIIIVVWLIILQIPGISKKIKSAITAIVVASPIPPIP